MGRHCARSSCPFCGWHYTDIVAVRLNIQKTYAVQCASCRARGPIGNSTKEASTLWETLTARLDRHGDQIQPHPHPSQLVPLRSHAV